MSKKINAIERWGYNAQDCAATKGAFDILLPMANEHQLKLYRAGITLEAVTLAIQMRGIKVNKDIRKGVLKELDAELESKWAELEKLAGKPVNTNSSDQVKALFYQDCGIKRMKNKDGRISVDRSILERIMKGRFELDVAQPRGEKQSFMDYCADMAKIILECRSVSKDKGMVNSTLDAGRIRTSLNVGATESFRFSASKTCFNRGANLQQVRGEIRRMMIADEGMIMVYGDQNRAESSVVAHLSGDAKYIAAHAAHDTHVGVAKLIWPDEPWTGDDEEDLAFSEQPNFIQHHSRRDMAKRTQHALNYYPPGDLRKYKLKGKGPHHTLSRELQISKKDAYSIVNRYFEPFSGIQNWQQEVIDTAKSESRVYYPGGFYRDLFGKRDDASTHREAISSIPQFVVAWTNHAVMVRLWELFDEPGVFEMLNHTHDAVLFQCDDWVKWKPRVEEVVKVEWPCKDGNFIIDWKFDTGSNWEEAS